MGNTQITIDQPAVAVFIDLSIDDGADDGNDIQSVVAILRDAVRGALHGSGFAKERVDDAIENFARMEP